MRAVSDVRLRRVSDDVFVWDPDDARPFRSEEHTIVVPGVATFRVTDGRRVVVTRADDADPVEVEASLEGRVTAVLLQQRRILPLHLASVLIDGRAVGFVGPPGAGKSSLVCALADRGHRPLTDDLAPVTTDEAGRVVVHPRSPVLRIWGASARQLGWPTDESVRIKVGLDKFRYAVPDRFADEPARLDVVYVLVDHPVDQVLIDPVRGFTRFDVLLTGATYGRDYLDTPAARAWHVAEVMRIGEQISMFTVRRPVDACLHDVASLLERHVTQARA